MDQCRIAVAVGMPWELFWRGPVWAFELYLAAYNQRTRDRQLAQDAQAWNIGQYTRAAMQSVFNLFNPFAGKQRAPRYPEKPYLIQREQEEKIKKEADVQSTYEMLHRRFPKRKGVMTSE